MNNADFAIYFIYYTKYPHNFLKQNGVHGLQNMSIYYIFEDEILKNFRFVEVPTSEFGLFIIHLNFLSCFPLVPEGGNENIF